MKSAAVLSSGRQDWGILRSLCGALRDAPGFELQLILGGMHGSPEFGRTRDLVVDEEGFLPALELEWIDVENVEKPGDQAGRALQQVHQALEHLRPDFLVLVGDRFETAAAALAANLAGVPLVHLHEGEETLGAIDNALRHAITKLSHLHLTSHPDHRARVIAMGESPESVHVVGAPGLDNLNRSDLPSREDLETRLGLELEAPVVIVTLHPATLGGDSATEARAMLDAMDSIPGTYVITLPNVDPGAEGSRRLLKEAGEAENRVAVEALGEQGFWALMREADAMLGNSSSALIEAPALQLPAVNIGLRQEGRLRGENVIDVSSEPADIREGLERALSPEFKHSLETSTSPFGFGDSSERILAILSEWDPPHPPIKPPIDLP